MQRVFRLSFKNGPTLYFTNFPTKTDVIPHVSKSWAKVVEDASWPRYHRFGKRVLSEGGIEMDSGNCIDNDKRHQPFVPSGRR